LIQPPRAPGLVRELRTLNRNVQLLNTAVNRKMDLLTPPSAATT
jgi:hypothetical protein